MYKPTVLTLLMLLIVPTHCAYGQDLRKQYGTRARQTAKLLDEGIKLVQDGHCEQGLKPIAEALKKEPGLQMALYWQGIAERELGNAKKSLSSYEQLFASAKPESRFIPMEGCFNAGVDTGQDGKLDESAVWLSRALELDPTNKYKRTARVYRNLAVTYAQQNDFSSALLCAVLGRDLSSDDIEQALVDDLSKRAKSEVATVLRSVSEPEEVPYRETVAAEEPTELASVQGEISNLLDITHKKMMLALPKDEKFYELIAYSHDMATKRVKTQGRPQAACYVGGKLYLSLTSPNRISEVDVVTGKEKKSWRLRTPAPSSIAVAPKHSVAFFCNSGPIGIIDLESGETTNSTFAATGIAADPTQANVFAYRTPDYEDTSDSGHILIRGRPVFFRIQGANTNPRQSTLSKFKIVDKGIMLSQTRLSAASNGQRLVVSPDGRFVSLVGGGGWRPQDRTAGSGYGVPVFDASDFGYVLRFVETGAYPLAAAFNPVSKLFVARGERTVLTHLVNDDELTLDVENAERSAVKDKLAAFSGDGRWLFVTDGPSLYTIEVPSAQGDATSWQKQLAKSWRRD